MTGEEAIMHCLVLRGSGSRAFIVGADIKELSQLNAATGRAFISGLRDLCNAVRYFPTPVIVRLEGTRSAVNWSSPWQSICALWRTMRWSACPR